MTAVGGSLGTLSLQPQLSNTTFHQATEVITKVTDVVLVESKYHNHAVHSNMMDDVVVFYHQLVYSRPTCVAELSYQLREILNLLTKLFFT